MFYTALFNVLLLQTIRICFTLLPLFLYPLPVLNPSAGTSVQTTLIWKESTKLLPKKKILSLA
jgi:hypothetical protein